MSELAPPLAARASTGQVYRHAQCHHQRAPAHAGVELKSDMRKVLALLQAYQAAAILPRPPELITGELDHE